MATQRLTRIYELQVQADQYNREMKKMVASTQKVEKRLGSIQDTFALIGKATAAVFAVKQATSFAVNMIKAADSVLLMESAYGQLLKSGERGADMMERVYKIAEETGVPLENVGKTVQQLALGLGALGASNSEIDAITTNILKLGRIGGKSIEDINGAAYQLSQALASGRLQGDEFRAVVERLPLVAQEIAHYLDVDIGKLKEMSAQGLITADVIRGALTGSSDSIDKSFRALPVIWEQGMARMQTATLRVAVELSKATQATTRLAEGMGVVAQGITGVAESVDDLIRGFRELDTVIGGVSLAILAGGLGRMAGVAASMSTAATAGGLLKAAFKSLKTVAAGLRFAGLLGALAFLILSLDRVKKLAEDVAAAIGGIAYDDLERRYEQVIKMGKELSDLEREYASRGGDENPRLRALRSEIGIKRRLYEESKRQLEADRENIESFNRVGEASKKAFSWLSEAGGEAKLPAYIDEVGIAAEKAAQALWDAADPARVLRRELAEIDVSSLYGLPDKIAGALRDSKIKEYLEDQFQISFALDPEWERDLESALQIFDTKTVELLTQLKVPQEVIDQARKLIEEKYILEPIVVTAKMKPDVEDAEDTITDWQKKMLNAVKGFQTDFVNTIVDGVMEGKLAFDDFAKHVLATLAKMALDKALSPIFQAITDALPGIGTASLVPAGGSGLAAAPALFAGPDLFGATGGRRMTVGVPQADGGFMTGRRGGVNVNVHNHGNSEVEVQTAERNGEIDIDILIESRVAKSLSSGGLDRAMAANYGLKRRAF